MKYIFLSLIVSFLGVLIFTSCKKEFSCEECAESNKAPIANAGPDQTTVLPKDSVVLDGSASSDADGTIKSFKWIIISGPSSPVITKPDGPVTSVTSLKMGVYQFELRVTDNGGLQGKDTVQIIVDNPAVNQPPIANAGPDQTITLPTNTITLDGSKSADPENNITGYAWTKIAGPASYNIATATAIQSQVTGLTEGTYQLQLTVTDAGGLFSRDTVQVTVNKSIANMICAGNRPEINASLIPFGTLSKARWGMAVASAGGKILYAGGVTNNYQDWGVSTVDIYDISTNSWSTAQLSVPRFDITAIAAGNKIFFAGGISGEIGDVNETYHSTVDIYDVSTNTWSVTNLSEEKYGVSAAAVDNKVFFAGGTGVNKIGNTTYYGHIKNQVEIYDFSTAAWSVSTLSEAKTGISVVALNNKIYFAGGGGRLGGVNYYSNTIDIYDNATNTWSTSSLSEPKSVSGIGVGNKIYWAGGYNNQTICKVEIKNVNTQTTSFESLSEPAAPLPVLKDNKIVFYKNVNRFDVLDYNTNTWSIGVLPESSPTGFTIISVNNTIYAAGGGRQVNGVYTYSNQVYKLEF